MSLVPINIVNFDFDFYKILNLVLIQFFCFGPCYTNCHLLRGDIYIKWFISV